MRHIILSIAVLGLVGLFISCSGSAEMAELQDEPQKEVSNYPSWYPQQEFVSDEEKLFAYSTAIDSDSAASIEKAKSWAVKELKSSVSDKLEQIRSEALVEYGSESGLDEAKFLMALRRVKNAVDPLVETGKTEVKRTEGYESVYGFAEVSVPKDELIKRIGKRLGAHEKAWNAMKDSKAFSKF
ncbi:hypothetical protein [Fodinibius sp.]|uniref:hypothetical protein n=1 Tax=Fodinibius sp. TaxID=1872440 RepID=UPI002ACDC0B9|nr:hypothetical protein [Fodinibius sp.]MDZ7659119.1 hypothetical protein [Fodinibius sp.]